MNRLTVLRDDASGWVPHCVGGKLSTRLRAC